MNFIREWEGEVMCRKTWEDIRELHVNHVEKRNINERGAFFLLLYSLGT